MNPFLLRRRRSALDRWQAGRRQTGRHRRTHNRGPSPLPLKHVRESAEKYRQIFENANDAIYLFELDERGLPGRILEVNEVACRRLGYSRAEYLAMDPAELDAPETDVDIPESMDRLRDQGHEQIELIHLAKDGTQIPVEVSSHLFTVNGRTRHLSIVRDIRERKQAEQRMHDSLREKEVLLQEIHHRVKNNLQLVSSLINLESRDIGERAAVDLQARVRALALVHEVLYSVEDLSTSRFDEYLTTLVGELQLIYGSGAVHLELALEPRILPIDTAVPLGLLVNEVVSNAFKHAHPNGEAGVLRIELSGDGGTQVRIADDGVGLPEHARSGDSLGLVLIDELSSQLNANVEVSRQKGTSYSIYIPEDRNAGS
ncbi:MAG: PAS domain S-box protein [Spirochaetes bacterium]|nr:PAS domain S-box protein [Spirochaetota bacterium]